MRRIISQLRVDCTNKGCEDKFQNADKQKHELQCQYRLIKCKYCEKDLLLKEAYEHKVKAHAEEVKKLLLNEYLPQQTEKSKVGSAVKAIEAQFYNPLAKVKNAKGLDAAFGDCLKYYCGGDLGFRCRCCDGHCGPTNG